MTVALTQSAVTARANTTPETWTVKTVSELFELPFPELMYRAQQVHRENFDPCAVQLSTLLSVKTGGCSEDCGYCSQAARHHTELEREALMDLKDVVEAARLARAEGATRFCMGAAWRGPKQKDLDSVTEMVRAVKDLGMETCVTLGMLKDGQAEQLREAGLDYYNHNLDTAPEFYGQVITTHTQQDRFDTLSRVRSAGVKVCSGGIIGMGETRAMRAGLMVQLANMAPPPESVPINNLVPIEGTPLENAQGVDDLEFVRTIAVARITMPRSLVRLSAGRMNMSDAVQAMCFMAGANSIFYGERLLTTGNADATRDRRLLDTLGMYPAES